MSVSNLPPAWPLPPPPPPPMMMIKLSFRGETHRLSMARAELTLPTLQARVHACYDDTTRPALWTLIYRDNENDLITVSTPEELTEACRVFTELQPQDDATTSSSSSSRRTHMHFHVVARITLKDQLAPVLQTVGEISGRLARAAEQAKGHLQQGGSVCVERGRDSLSVAGRGLSSATRGLSRRLRRASSMASEQISGIRERVDARRRSRSESLFTTRTSASSLGEPLRPQTRISRMRFWSQELVREQEQVQDDEGGSGSGVALMATAVERDEDDDVVPELVPVAELLAQARLQSQQANEEEQEEDGAHEEDSGDTAASNQEEPALVVVDVDASADVELEDEPFVLSSSLTESESVTGSLRITAPRMVAEPMVAPTSDAETASTGSDDEMELNWDVVSINDPPSPIFDVDDEDEMEAYFGRYEAELSLIRQVAPHVDPVLCVDLLEQHNGEVDAVLIDLTAL